MAGITEIIAMVLYMSMAVTILIAVSAAATPAGSKKLASYIYYKILCDCMAPFDFIMLTSHNFKSTNDIALKFLDATEHAIEQ